MIVKLLSFMAIGLGHLFSPDLYAKEIYFGKAVESLYLVYKEEAILKFPSQVKTISKVSDFEIAPLDPDNPDYSTLSIKPIFKKSKGKVSFILDSGKVISVKMRTLAKNVPSKTDQVYIFKPKEDLINSPRSQVNVSALDLMKGMIRGDNVTGYKTRSLVRTIWGLNGDLQAKLVKVYTGEKFTGHVFKLKNKSYNKEVKLDLSQLRLGTPNKAILGQLDKRVIPPAKTKNNSSYLRIVSKPSAVYLEVNLPFDLIGEEK